LVLSTSQVELVFAVLVETFTTVMSSLFLIFYGLNFVVNPGHMLGNYHFIMFCVWNIRCIGTVQSLDSGLWTGLWTQNGLLI